MTNGADPYITLNIYAGTSTSGKVAVEEVVVEHLLDQQYLLLSAPGLALNLAKNDIFEWMDAQQPVGLIKRDGNFNIHIYHAQLSLEEYEDFKAELWAYLGGTTDGIRDNNLAITIPAQQGIDKINGFFINFANLTQNEWMFTNIYKNYQDLSDDTLLDWWQQDLTL